MFCFWISKYSVKFVNVMESWVCERCVIIWFVYILMDML